jgi:hypothetical protein
MNRSLGHLFQYRPQSLASALHSHFQCRHSYAGEVGHRLVTQIFDMFQHECFALVHSKHAESALNLLGSSCVYSVRIGQITCLDAVIRYEAALPTVPPGFERSAFIDYNAIKPRPESLRFIALSKVPVSTNECRLQHVFGIGVITQHPNRETEMKIPVTLDQYAERVNVTVDDSGY